MVTTAVSITLNGQDLTVYGQYEPADRTTGSLSDFDIADIYMDCEDLAMQVSIMLLLESLYTRRTVTGHEDYYEEVTSIIRDLALDAFEMRDSA